MYVGWCRKLYSFRYLIPIIISHITRLKTSKYPPKTSPKCLIILTESFEVQERSARDFNAQMIANAAWEFLRGSSSFIAGTSCWATSGPFGASEYEILGQIFSYENVWLKKLGLDEGIMSWDLKNGFLAKNYPYGLIPRSKLANPSQSKMLR